MKPKDPNIRWKWMAGTGVVAGAVASGSSMAGVVQISLPNNQVTSGGPNSLSADITRDGVADLTGLTGPTVTGSSFSTTFAGKNYVRSGINSASVYSLQGSHRQSFGWVRFRKGFTSTTNLNSVTNSFSSYLAIAGGEYTNQNSTSGTAPGSVRGLTAVTFTDGRINGGAPTAGFVDVRTFNTNQAIHTVQLVRLVFNDSSTAAPAGVVPGSVNREFDPTVYAQRIQLSNKIKKLKKKAKKLNETNKIKSKKLNKKAKKLSKRLTAIA